MMEFLYFPDDKTAYIVPAITMLIFFIGALVTMKVIIRSSKKQLEEQENRFSELQSEIQHAGKEKHPER